MYINLLLGVIFLIAVVWLVRAWLQERKPPRLLLEEELRRKHERQKAPEETVKLLREMSLQRLRPVLQAAEDMREALPASRRFTAMLSDEGLLITLPEKNGEKPVLLVRHRVQIVPLAGGKEALEAALKDGERFVLSRPGHEGWGEMTAYDQDECIRMVARELANFLD
ncbi:hypothetical protein [Oleidesulfovibrio sp.]|uniref:hypothetical protein n=1 Tax=Oleidesulfovibrio sp. TaxID=2909707 RepID=UPI003A879A3A